MALIKCTHCGKETNNEREKCLLCGKKIPEDLRFKEEISVKEKVKLDKPSAKENPKSNTKNCPFCFEEIKKKAKELNEFEIVKITKLTNKDKSIVYCEVHKKVYIANKAFFKEKQKARINKKAK